MRNVKSRGDVEPLVRDGSSDDSSDDESKHQKELDNMDLSQFLASEIRMVRHDFHPTPFKLKFFRRPVVCMFVLAYVVLGLCLPIYFMFEAGDNVIASMESDLMNVTEVGKNHTSSFFAEDPVKLRMAISRLCLIPVTWLAVLIVFPHLCQHSLLPFLLMLAVGLRSCLVDLMHKKYHSFIEHLIDHLTVMLLLIMSLIFLEYLDHVVQDLVTAERHLLEEKQVKKMRGILHAVTHTGNEAKDKFNTTKNITSIAEVMYTKVWYVVYQTSRCVALLVFFSFSVKGDNEGGPILAVGVLYVFAMGVLAGFKFWDKASLLLNIWTHKPFFVGDLVTIGGVSGFVEHITLSYIVIRTFNMKQAWMPLMSLQQDIIQNWTRRPFKPINLSFFIKGRFDAPSLEKLVRFGNEWVDQHEGIQQKGYKKFECAGCEDGAEILVIFFPNLGVDKGDLRQEFVFAFMEASTRLGLNMSPNCLLVQNDPSVPRPNPEFASLFPQLSHKKKG